MYHKLIDYIEHMTKGNVPVIIRAEDIAARVDAHPIPCLSVVQDHLQRAGCGVMRVTTAVDGVHWEILIAHRKPITYHVD